MCNILGTSDYELYYTMTLVNSIEAEHLSSIFDKHRNYLLIKATDHNLVRKFYLKDSCKNSHLYSK